VDEVYALAYALSRVMFDNLAGIAYISPMTPVRLRVEELRKAKGWTQKDLSDRAGIRRATVADIEAGRTKGVDFETLERLADAFGLDAALLVSHTRKPLARNARQP
jgi:DNA-binding Xre family transcriptional regulator